MSCDAGACDAGSTCDDGCGSGCGDGCGSGGLKGLLSRLCNRGGACGRVRMVNRLSSDSKPNGEKCTYKWSAEPACGNCGSCAACDGESDCDSIR